MSVLENPLFHFVYDSTLCFFSFIRPASDKNADSVFNFKVRIRLWLIEIYRTQTIGGENITSIHNPLLSYRPAAAAFLSTYLSKTKYWSGTWNTGMPFDQSKSHVLALSFWKNRRINALSLSVDLVCAIRFIPSHFCHIFGRLFCMGMLFVSLVWEFPRPFEYQASSTECQCLLDITPNVCIHPRSN